MALTNTEARTLDFLNGFAPECWAPRRQSAAVAPSALAHDARTVARALQVSEDAAASALLELSRRGFARCDDSGRWRSSSLR